MILMAETILVPRTNVPAVPVAALHQRPPSATSLQLLSDLSKEKKVEPARTAQVHQNKALAKILEIFLQISEEYASAKHGDLVRHRAFDLLENLGYKAADVTAFSKMLPSLEAAKNPFMSGGFLTALVSKCADEEHVLYVHNIPPPEHLGLRMQLTRPKKIIVHGDVGEAVCSESKYLSMIVNGNAGSLAASNMYEGSSLVVNGNVGDILCEEAHHGEVTINGNAGDYIAQRAGGVALTITGNAGYSIGTAMWAGFVKIGGSVRGLVGDAMRGGTIEINGDFDLGDAFPYGKVSSICSTIKGGNIFHKGKQIVKDGVRLE